MTGYKKTYQSKILKYFPHLYKLGTDLMIISSNVIKLIQEQGCWQTLIVPRFGLFVGMPYVPNFSYLAVKNKFIH